MLRPSLLAALAALALAAPVSGRQQAAAPAAQLPAVTAAAFFVSGRGWGHGVGMSQYGALGLATGGAAYDGILKHFYTGVELGPAPVARMRVLVAEAQPAVTVASTVPFRVRDVFGQILPLPAGSVTLGPQLELTVNGAPAKLAGPLVFLPGSAALTLGRTAYRGQLVVSVAAAKLDVVNDVGLEQYLAGVVPREMPASWPAEALKAQAVAARSYALANRISGRPYDVYADVRSQVYGGIGSEDARATAAIAATAGQVMLYGGRIVNALFHSTSGGRTVSAAEVFGMEVPYLVPVDDPGSALSPVHAWGPVPVTDVALRKALALATPVRALRLVRTPSGRVGSVVATTTVGERSFRGTEVRRALGLRSTWITSLRTLALSRPGGPVVHGGTVVLTATAEGATGAVLARRAGGVWQQVASRPAAGVFTAKVRVTAPATFRLSAGSLGGPTLKVPVAPRVTARIGVARSVSGVVTPVVPGRPVELQVQGERGWTTTARATTVADGSYSLAARQAGSYRVRVAPSGGFAQGLSAVLRVP